MNILESFKLNVLPKLKTEFKLNWIDECNPELQSIYINKHDENEINGYLICSEFTIGNNKLTYWVLDWTYCKKTDTVEVGYFYNNIPLKTLKYATDWLLGTNNKLIKVT